MGSLISTQIRGLSKELRFIERFRVDIKMQMVLFRQFLESMSKTTMEKAKATNRYAITAATNNLSEKSAARGLHAKVTTGSGHSRRQGNKLLLSARAKLHITKIWSKQICMR